MLNFVVDRAGTFLAHDSDPAAVDEGRSMSEWVTPRTWRWVEAAINRCLGTGGREIVFCCGRELRRAVWRLKLQADGERVRVTAEHVENPTPETLEAMLAQSADDDYTLTLIDPAGGSQTAEYTTRDLQQALAWVQGWLAEPLGLGVGVYPPGVRVPA